MTYVTSVVVKTCFSPAEPGKNFSVLSELDNNVPRLQSFKQNFTNVNKSFYPTALTTEFAKLIYLLLSVYSLAGSIALRKNLTIVN